MQTIIDKLLGSARTAIRTPLNNLFNLVDPPVLVLIYHRVTTLASDPEMLAVTPDNFRAQLRHLKEHLPLLRFEEDWSKARRPAAVITFDDGYADNALEALPIIEEVGAPATFFVTTGTIGTTREFWWHELERIILGSKVLPASFTLNNGRYGKTWPTATRGDRQKFYHEIIQMSNAAAPEQRADWLAQLRLWASHKETNDTAHRVMTVDELQLLAKSRWVTIGAHTVTHTRLASLTRVAQREEITSSKKQLEQWLGREITVFSYPFGRRCDYSKETPVLCREAGFIKAAANFPGQAHRWTDPYQIPRLLVRNWPLDVFIGKLREFRTR